MLQTNANLSQQAFSKPLTALCNPRFTTKLRAAIGLEPDNKVLGMLLSLNQIRSAGRQRGVKRDTWAMTLMLRRAYQREAFRRGL